MTTNPFLGRSRTITETSSSSNNSNFLSQFVKDKPINELRLEEVIDVDKDIDNFGNNTISLPKPQILYHVGRWKRNTGLFSHNSERSLSITENDQEIVNLVSTEASKELLKKDYKYFHPGIIVIGIKSMIRRHVGAKLLVIVYDSRWNSNINASLLAMTEVDLNENKGLFYFSPGYFLETKDFCKHIKIAFKVKGFEGFNSSKNIILCIGILGKCMENTTLNFKVNIDKVIEQIASKGIQLIEPPKIDATENAGLEWNLETIFSNRTPLINPTQGIIYKNPDGTTSLRFRNYENTSKTNEESDSDTEEINNLLKK